MPVAERLPRMWPPPWCVQADVQIYNKVLALIEDWAEAIDVPAYRAAHEQLKARAASLSNLICGLWTQNRVHV